MTGALQQSVVQQGNSLQVIVVADKRSQRHIALTKPLEIRWLISFPQLSY
jgi:hypothetical protein